jgi:redox-sensitive bicupin YhaK (pirin superfamily)
MTAPRYRDVRHDTVPIVRTPDGAEIRIIAGKVGQIAGPVRDVVSEPEYLDVSLPAGTEFTHLVAPGHTIFAYVVDGEGYFEPGRDAFGHDAVGTNYFDLDVPCACHNGTLVLYGPGDALRITTEQRSVRFLLASGKPIGEPIAWYGPIVMNTRDELRLAFEELDKGTFIKEAGQ